MAEAAAVTVGVALALVTALEGKYCTGGLLLSLIGEGEVGKGGGESEKGHHSWMRERRWPLTSHPQPHQDKDY